MNPATAENGWINTIDSDHPDVIATAHRIIESIHYCALSTCSPDGFPWSSPVLFVYDKDWNIYWSSAIASTHSQNLYGNGGRAAIAIYDTRLDQGSVKGLYFTGTASELNPAQVESIMKQLFDRAGTSPNRTAQDYLGDSPRRFYCFQPQEIWVTGERLAIGNQLVDTKIRLNFDTLLQRGLLH